jgi:hypothetical protein
MNDELVNLVEVAQDDLHLRRKHLLNFQMNHLVCPYHLLRGNSLPNLCPPHY